MPIVYWIRSSHVCYYHSSYLNLVNDSQVIQCFTLSVQFLLWQHVADFTWSILALRIHSIYFYTLVSADIQYFYILVSWKCEWITSWVTSYSLARLSDVWWTCNNVSQLCILHYLRFDIFGFTDRKSVV